MVVAAILKNCQCIQIVNVLYVNLMFLYLSFFFFLFFFFLFCFLTKFVTQFQVETMQRHNVLSIEHHQKLYTAKEALAFFERNSEDQTSSLSSSSSPETESDEDVIPPSPKINKVRHTLVSIKISKIPKHQFQRNGVNLYNLVLQNIQK